MPQPRFEDHVYKPINDKRYVGLGSTDSLARLLVEERDILVDEENKILTQSNGTTRLFVQYA